MNILKKCYRYCKTLPVIGRGIIALRSIYMKSFFERKRLYKRDYTKALEVLSEMFPEHTDVRIYLDELVSSDIFKTKYSYGHSGDFDIMILYGLIRLGAPETVLETGVASGRSSAAILSAMKKNNKGTLHSIDLPQHYNEKPDLYVTHEGNEELTGFVPEGLTPGWIVPDSLRSRWNLVLGNAKYELPKLLETLDTVDIFYHDSDHSQEHMAFEFNAVYPKIEDTGVVLSDDVSWNDAWAHFISQHSAKEICIYRNFGIAKK